MLRRGLGGWLALVLLCLATSLFLQSFVGNKTIYRPAVAEARLELHRAIINADSEKNWNEAGANSVSRRLAVPWAVELLHRTTGVSVAKLYRGLSTLCLAAALFLQFILLRRFHEAPWAFLGVLLFAAAMLGTYAFHYFHPWDRPGLVMWVAFFLAALGGRFRTAAVLVAVGMFIKFDLLFAPFLFFALHGRKAIKPAAALMAITASVFLFLNWLRQEPQSTPLGAWELIEGNIQHFAELGLSHPPLLVFTPLLVLGALVIRHAPRPTVVLFLFAAAHLPLYFLQTRFRELRAMSFLVAAMLPLAIFGLRRLSGYRSTQ